MKHYLVISSDEGGEITFEISGPEGGMIRASRGDEYEKTVSQLTLQEAVDKARLLSNVMVTTLSKVSSPPDEFEVQFGMKMEEFGCAISQDNTNANILVTLKWRSDININKA